MTIAEKIVVSAYTGYLMCDFDLMHQYIEKVMGRPVWTHEMAGHMETLYIAQSLIKL